MLLGVSVSLSEAEVHWRASLEGLRERGLEVTERIASENHTGLQAAPSAVFPLLRLVPAMAAEITEEWETERIYLSPESE